MVSKLFLVLEILQFVLIVFSVVLTLHKVVPWAGLEPLKAGFGLRAACLTPLYRIKSHVCIYERYLFMDNS